MAIRANHYDAAFEAYLRQARWPYIAVDEARRTCVADGTLKSLDFVVTSPLLGPLLIDVKGRRAPLAGGRTARPFENWATADDLASMEQWEALFGANYRALLVFAYWLSPTAPRADLPVMLEFRQRQYSFFGVWANDYRDAMKIRSPKWETVWLQSASFKELRFPLHLSAAPPAITVS